MRVLFILTVVTVNFGFKYVRSFHQTENKAIGGGVENERKFHENFQSLFDSIAHSDKNEIDRYRDALRGEATKEQNAFDATKDEMISARIQNSYKKIDYQRKNNANENSIMLKRQIPMPTGFKHRGTPRPKHGCEIQGGTLAVGRCSIDVDRCMVWFCNHNLEVEDYGCKEIEKHQDRYPMFWSECNAVDCFKR